LQFKFLKTQVVFSSISEILQDVWENVLNTALDFNLYLICNDRATTLSNSCHTM